MHGNACEFWYESKVQAATRSNAAATESARSRVKVIDDMLDDLSFNWTSTLALILTIIT